MGVREVQLTSKSHPENILASLHQLRLEGHLSDVTVQVDCEGEVQDFKAHQVMLAASSGYFKKIILSQSAAQDKVLLSNMHSSDFSKFLEFVYTGKVQVHSDKIGDVHAMAQFLDCKDLVDVCSETMSAGVLQKRKKKSASSNVVDTDNLHDSENVQSPKGKKQPKSLKRKEMLSPESTENSSSKRLKDIDNAKDGRQPGGKVKLKLVDHEAPQTTGLNTTENTEEREDWAASEAEPERGDKTVDMTASEEDEWENKDNERCDDPDDPLFLELGGEGEGEDETEVENEEESMETVKRTSKAQLQCNKCQRTFHYERSYLKHISTYHGVQAEVIYRCETCQQTFANRSNLNTHEKHVHSTERLHACDNCPKTFKRKKDVVRHQKQVHERNYMYNVCSDCGKTLSSKAALLLHKRIHTGTKPYECAECGARFTQNSALKMHSRIHTGEKPFACDQCDSRFNQKHMLAYHKRSHTGEKPFMCEACGKSFASKEYLRHHSNIHTGSRPFKCEQCGRGFAQRNSLNQHLKIHTGERPYGCKFCEKQFTQLNALQRHQRIHTGEKPYMCGLCTRTFTDKSTLRRHTMIHDSDAPWKTYLVVLKGNVEDKPPKAPTKSKAEKAGAGEKKSTTKKKSAAAAGEASAAGAVSAAAATAPATSKTQSDSIMVAAEQVTVPSDWTSHGTIALVSHGALGGLAVIHTDMPPGTQIQPIVTTDGTGTSVLSLDGSTIPFSLPVSVAHHIPLSSDAPSSAVALPALSVPAPALSVPAPAPIPVSISTLASVSQTTAVCTASVLEAVATQTVLAAESEPKTTAETDVLPPDIQTVIITDGGFVKEETATGQIIKEQKETREAAGNACE